MIEIKTIATGSKGNCYYLNDGSTPLLLEAGIPFKRIQEGIDFKTSSIKGVLVTHEHLDHAKAVADCLKRGMPLYMTEGTRLALKLTNPQIHIIKAKQQLRIGTWTILPFDTQHDVAEPVGFLLQSDHGYKVLFATDTYYIKYRFSGVTHMLIECNYDMKTLLENYQQGKLHPAQYKRVLKSHFSLENVLDFLQANDLSKLEEIHLLHLSDSNSNQQRIYEAVARATGKLIFIH